MSVHWALPVVGLLAVPGLILNAQAPTGKIQGRVQDETGTPIADAQVFIIGTAFAAMSDPRGHYFINNIPAGPATVRAAYVGYRPVEVRGLRVRAGQTVTQDFALEVSPVQLQELEVIAAENLLVPRDEVTSKQRVQGDFLERLPVDRVNDLLALQPGVVATGRRGPLALSIRGARPDEAVTYVDGVPVTPGYRGLGLATPSTQISVGTNAIEEASIITGANSAEFGNAQSGLISLVTRTGGTRFSGALGFETDEPFGVSHSLGFNRIEASVGGPVARNLTFFTAGVLEGQRSAAAGRGSEQAPIFVSVGLDTTVAVPRDRSPLADTTQVPVYRLAVYRGECDQFRQSANPDIRDNYGLPCQGIRIPQSVASIFEIHNKLTYTFGSGSRVGLSYQRSQNQGRRFDYANLYNAPALFGSRDWSDVLTLTWTPNLARSAERALALEVYLSYQEDRSILSPLTRRSESATRDPFGGYLIRPLGFLFDFDNFPLDSELVENVRLNRPGTKRTPYDLENPGQFNLVDRYRNNAYGLSGWSESGGPVGQLRLFRENRYLAKTNLDWQADRFNRLKVGAEWVVYSIGRYESELSAVGDAYLERPVRWNAFVEDRLDLGDVVLIGGLRYDRYSARASRPFLLDTVVASATFGEYVNLPGAPIYEAGGTFESRPLVISRPDRAHGYLSPHIQVSFPVTERTNLRLSYAHQVQAPDFALVLNGVNTGGLGADLDFGKTVAFEFGVRHAFSDDMVLDVAVYNRDNLAAAAARTFLYNDPVRQRRSTLRRVTNLDFGNARGVDVRLDRRFGNFFNGTISYSYQNAKSTASDPLTNQDRGVTTVNEIGGILGPPPQEIIPTVLSRPHDLGAAVAFTLPGEWKKGSVLGSVLGDLGLFATARFATGTPYTPCEVASESGGCRIAGAPNSARLPTSKQFDLRVTKGLELGGLALTAYLDARNLFDFTNVLRVFDVNGTTLNPADRQVQWAADSSSFAEDAGASRVYRGDGAIDLRFQGALASGCDAWVTAGDRAAAPDCVYLIRAEERYGDGDHVFTLAEQRRASDAFYAVDRGEHNFTGDPRRLRLGLEVTF
ncbi:MAG: TonB-dependent receptor [Acidobacteria bacterium]|nr:TonB-dependent receptor [Acidobacteriota bacterium]